MIEYCMRVVICDDEPGDLQDVAFMTREVAKRKGISCEFALYESCAALLDAIQGGTQ